MKKRNIMLKFFQSGLSGLAFLWLIVEAHNQLVNNIWNIEFWILIFSGFLIGIIWFFINGFCIEGFLRQSISIDSNAFQSKVKIYYGNLFKQKGYKVIPVNNFFDSLVDEQHVSSQSLHGKFLQNYWNKNIQEWDEKVEEDLRNIDSIEVVRSTDGKQKQYEIGTSVKVDNGTDKFICVALSKTNIENLEAYASIEDFKKALKGLLEKARSVCAGEKLNIPLLGSGLSRTGVKINMLINLIILAIFEESKKREITEEINIILPKNKKKEISLSSIEQNWR